jgi:hypothetical protein
LWWKIVAKLYIISMQFGKFSGQQGVLNKGPTVWFDRAGPCTHPYPTLHPGNMPAEPNGIPTPKNMFASMKKLAVKIAKSCVRMI